MHQFVPVTPEEVFQEPNPVPQRFDTLEAMWEWHKPLLEAENGENASMRRNTPLDEAETGLKSLMAKSTTPPTPEVKKALASFGASLLKTFHAEYQRNSESRSMDYHRGIVIGWRYTLDALYGQRITEEIVEAAAEEANLTIPPAADVDDDGNWIGFDSGAHTYIGKLHE